MGWHGLVHCGGWNPYCGSKMNLHHPVAVIIEKSNNEDESVMTCHSLMQPRNQHGQSTSAFKSLLPSHTSHHHTEQNAMRQALLASVFLLLGCGITCIRRSTATHGRLACVGVRIVFTEA
mmetsp:Transcript_9087/g.24543  ORF Transcript_9087/g.24543 Transcript_9087/m.24543 type:complete len:120 (+) Transcript_9087:1200-1559(+)